MAELHHGKCYQGEYRCIGITKPAFFLEASPHSGKRVNQSIISLLTKGAAMYDKNKLKELQASLENWEETSLSKALASLPERDYPFITTSSEPINRLYTPLDVSDADYGPD